MPTSDASQQSTSDEPRELKPLHTANSVYYPALDGLRAVALAAVFLDHYCHVPLFALGVSVFFVLSGFLITGILWDTREQAHKVRNFYVRRTLRIFPLYYAVFAVLLLTTPYFHWQWTSPWALWPLYLGNLIMYIPQWLPKPTWMLAANAMLEGKRGYTMLMGHFWSLCVEEQFYLIWPWIVFKASRKFLVRFCWVIVIVSPLLRVLAGYTFPPAAIRANVQFRTLFFQADALLLGALLAFAMRDEWRQKLLRLGRFLPDLFLLATLVYTYCCIDLHIAALHQPFLQAVKPLTWQFTIADVLGLGLILGTLQPASLVYKICYLRPLRWVGRISYGAYVFHDMPHLAYLALGRRLLPAHAEGLTAVIAVGGTLGLATLSYYCFEKPFLKMKDRLTLTAA